MNPPTDRAVCFILKLASPETEENKFMTAIHAVDVSVTVGFPTQALVSLALLLSMWVDLHCVGAEASWLSTEGNFKN